MNINPFGLKGKQLLVTGASSGIGRAIAIECAKMGASVVLTGRREIELAATMNLMEGVGHSLIVADILVDGQRAELVRQSPQYDGVVHSAGVAQILPFQFLSEVRMHQVFDINLFAPTLLSQQLLNMKKIRKRASFVWISSIAGNMCTCPGNAVYSASKSAVAGMLKGMAIDLAPKGIRVNSVNPGIIETDFLVGDVTQDQMEVEVARYPLKRFGRPEEVAYAVIYLLSDASSWVTGSQMLVDGGFTLL